MADLLYGLAAGSLCSDTATPSWGAGQLMLDGGLGSDGAGSLPAEQTDGCGLIIIKTGVPERSCG